jgi:hypothetical protein
MTSLLRQPRTDRHDPSNLSNTGARAGSPGPVLSCAMRFLWTQGGLLAAVAVVASALGACGPNLRMVAEGEVEFERCRGVEDDPSAANDERLQCWNNWQQTFTVGQSAERTQHARVRIAALSRGDGSSGGQQPVAGPTTMRGPTPAPGAPASSTVAAGQANGVVVGAPSGSPGVNGVYTVNNPPNAGPNAPPTSTGPAGPTSSAGPSSVPSPAAGSTTAPPGASCSGTCRDGWSACNSPCGRGDSACVARCDDVYRDCMRGCY